MRLLSGKLRLKNSKQPKPPKRMRRKSKNKKLMILLLAGLRSCEKRQSWTRKRGSNGSKEEKSYLKRSQRL
jgi:hypothetical protein